MARSVSVVTVRGGVDRMVYSLDLRQRIFAVYQSGEDSVRRIAARFSVAQATVKNLVRLERETHSLVPRKPGPPALPIWTDTNIHNVLRDMVAEDNHATLAEYCDRLEKQTGTRMSVPQMSELLKHLKQYRKKNSSGARRRLRESPASS
jgi:transposase